MLRRLYMPILMTVFAAFALPAIAATQPTGSLGGKVYDPDGTLVIRLEAPITLTDTTTGTKLQGQLRMDGSYAIDKVPAGTYTLQLMAPSRLYDPLQRANVVVAAGKPTALDLRLPWGMNLGTVGDDPLIQGADLRAKTKNVDGPVKRTADGKPDLTGVWTNIADGSPPPAMAHKPWAQKIADELAALKQDNPGAYCLPQVAIPSMMSYPSKFVQTPEVIVQITEDMDPGYRQIFLDGRPHPDPDNWNPAWYGHSVGKWEGDTLVVDTRGFNEITNGFGVHTENLHVVERYTRLSHGRMKVELFAEDPEAWTAPFKRSWMMGLAEGTEIVEFVCAEGYESKVMQRAPWKGRP
jgi:Carboxypeptidase regulatory-like domain